MLLLILKNGIIAFTCDIHFDGFYYCCF